MEWSKHQTDKWTGGWALCKFNHLRALGGLRDEILHKSPYPYSFLGTNTVARCYSYPNSGNQPEGRVADKYPKGAENSKSAKHLKGKPQLNGFVSGSKGAFELDSNRSNISVNLHFLTSFTSNMGTQSPITQPLITNIELSNIASLPDPSIEWVFISAGRGRVTRYCLIVRTNVLLLPY